MKFKTISNFFLISALALGLSSCKYDEDEYQSAVDAAYDQGYAAGEPNGYNNGYNQGERDGYSKGYDQAIADTANPEYWEGYDDGYADGDSPEAFNDGYNDGLNTGYRNGYNDGYTDGDAAAFAEGYQDGVDDSYYIGYADGLIDGELSGYDIGYDDGLIDGYDTGVSVGYNTGFDDGYDYGIIDGYDIGVEDGYTIGFDDGYTVGYDDGWYAAGGSSKSTKSRADKMLSLFLTDLIDFNKLKTPKQVLNDPKTKKMLLSSSAGMTVDTKKKKAVLNKYIVNAMKNQLMSKFNLPEKRSHQIAKLANHMIKASNTGETNMDTLNRFSKKVLGANFGEMKNAYKSSLQGKSKKLDDLVKKAADLNEITPEHTQKIMGQLFL